MFTVNMTDFSEKEIKYWFTIFDEFRNVSSKAEEANIDLDAPRISRFDYSADSVSSRVEFILEIDEPNFDKISYFDPLDGRPNWRVLCNLLKNKLCSVKRSFLIDF